MTILKGTNVTPGVIVLDYGANVEGHPTFQVISAAGDTSVLEVTYSETKAVLNSFYMVSASPPILLGAHSNTYCRAMGPSR
jgi:hypothetical protein